jgi:hypothetical protein
MLPLKLLMAYLVAKYLKKRNEIKIILIGYILSLVHSVMQFILVINLNGYNINSLIIIVH